LEFPIGIIEFRHRVNVFREIFSVPYTITDFQAPETL